MPFATLAVVQAIDPVNLTGLLATFMALSVALIPVIGLTARFALKPTVEALGRFFDKKGSEDAVSILDAAAVERASRGRAPCVQRHKSGRAVGLDGNLAISHNHSVLFSQGPRASRPPARPARPSSTIASRWSLRSVLTASRARHRSTGAMVIAGRR